MVPVDAAKLEADSRDQIKKDTILEQLLSNHRVIGPQKTTET